MNEASIVNVRYFYTYTVQYQVPQFTDVEDKIFGPLTLKQFIYIAGGGGLSFLLWSALPSIISIPLALGVMGFSLALAFMKVNDKPLIITIEAAFMYVFHGKLYLWSSHYAEKHKKIITKSDKSSHKPIEAPTISENRLTSLAWSLDINERLLKKHSADTVADARL